MKNKTPESIVRMESIKFSFIGLGFAYLIFGLLGGYDGIGRFIYNWTWEFFMAFCGLYITIWVLGGILGKLIYSKKINILMSSMLITFSSLIVSVFMGSLVVYFDEGILQTNGFQDYIIKPILTILLFGGIPALIVGALLGFRIEYKFRELFSR